MKARTDSPTSWLALSRQTATRSASANRTGENLPDGAMSPDGHIWGCYLHGIFASTHFRRAWLRSLGWQEVAIASNELENDRFSLALNRLTDTVEAALDMSVLETIIWGS